MHTCQPFMLSLMLGHKYDLEPEVHGEVIMLFGLVWMYFREHKKARITPLSQDQFEKKQQQNLRFLKYLEGETTGSAAHTKATAADMQRMQSKALWTAIVYRFNERKALQNLEGVLKAMVLIGLKSIIEGLEQNTGL